MTAEQVPQQHVPVSKLPPTANVVEVDPHLAERWLGKCVRNRHLRPNVVGAYASDMLADAWQLTGEAIKFDTDGHLIDGQHRLQAVIRSGATVRMFVVWGLATAAQDVMDSGARREARDMLHLAGHRNASAVSSAARLALAYEDGALTMRGSSRTAGRPYTHTQIKTYVDENPDIEEAVDLGRNLHLDLSPTVKNVALFLLMRVDTNAAHAFFTSLANAATEGADDPRSVLLRRLAAARRNNEKLSPYVQLALTFRAWNAWRKGQRLSTLPVASSHGIVPIPNPI